jgi:glutamate dehydrogenase (NADP+)
VVVPDILADAGGATVSWVEWVRSRQGMAWTLAELRSAADAVALRRRGAALDAGGTRPYFRGDAAV